MATNNVSTLRLLVGMFAKFQQVAAPHKTSGVDNMDLYTHGSLINCNSLLSAFIHLAFVFAIVIFMLWHHTRGIKPQNGTT